MSQPPKKRVTIIAETVAMLEYSAIGNMENFIALYSVWYPAISSDSASGRSKGSRLVSAMIVTLFFGGWDIPGISWDQQGGVLQTVATAAFMFLKVLFFLFLFMWIRWTLPRFRYDQLMSLGWKVMLPLALVYIMVTTVAIWVIETLAGIGNPRLAMGILFGLNLGLGYLVFFVLDRGLILSGSYRAPRPGAPGASRAGMAA